MPLDMMDVVLPQYFIFPYCDRVDPMLTSQKQFASAWDSL